MIENITRGEYWKTSLVVSIGVDLNLLLVLHTVLVERNVARAAERLHVTPSAVSNSLARLRDVFGDPLVTRKGRGVVPTPRALEIAPGIARAVREIEGALAPTSFDAESCTRTFTLAMADVGQVIWGPALAIAMARRLPRARLRVVGIDSLLSLGDLTSSEVDLQVGIAGKGPGLYAERLVLDDVVLVEATPTEERSAPPLAERGHVRVDMVPARNLRDRYAAAFAKAGVARDVVMTVPSFMVAAEIVSRTELVTMLPSSLLKAKGAALGLRAIALPSTLAPPPIELAMCWHERTHSDPAARAFRALVRDVVSAQRPRGASLRTSRDRRR